MSFSGEKLGLIPISTVSIKRGTLVILAHEDVTLDPPWKHDGQLVLGMGSCGYAKHVIQLLKGPLHCLGQEKENENECNKIEKSVETESALGSESAQHVREGQRED